MLSLTLVSASPAGPIQRFNSYLVPETGAHTAVKTGTYFLRFDNSFSWTRAKAVSLTLEVLAPDNNTE